MTNGREFDLLADMIGKNGERVETMARALGEVGEHCATLLERTKFLATRDDLSEAIRLHAGDCEISRLPKAPHPRQANGNMGRLVKALAAFLTVAAAALAAWLGFAE